MQIPESIPLNKEGQYCIQCFSGPIKRIFRDGLTYYECLACSKISERSLVIDNHITWWIDEKGTYWHESVGVVVVNQEKKMLCLLRKIYPFAYTIPAGHLDAGEQPDNAAIRELQEETGLTFDMLELMSSFDITGDSCRRGCDDHRWHLYRVHVSSAVRVQLSDEASRIKWLTMSEFKKTKNIIYPIHYIIDTFGDSLVDEK